MIHLFYSWKLPYRTEGFVFTRSGMLEEFPAGFGGRVPTGTCGLQAPSEHGKNKCVLGSGDTHLESQHLEGDQAFEVILLCCIASSRTAQATGVSPRTKQPSPGKTYQCSACMYIQLFCAGSVPQRPVESAGFLELELELVWPVWIHHVGAGN